MPQDKRDLGEQTLEGTIGGWGEDVAEDESDRTVKPNSSDKDSSTAASGDPGN